MRHSNNQMQSPMESSPPTDLPSSPRSGPGQVPIAHPIYHNIGPKQRAQIQAWVQEHQPDIGGLVFIFVFLLCLGGLWRVRKAIAEWFFERSRDKARLEWRDRERKLRRTVVVVGILRNGISDGESGNGGGSSDTDCGKGKVSKSVRFLDGEYFDGLDGKGDRVVVVNEVRAEALLDVLEDGSVVGEVF